MITNAQSHYFSKKFYEALGLLVSREISVERAAQMAGYSLVGYLEILEKKGIFPFMYTKQDYEMDLQNLSHFE